MEWESSFNHLNSFVLAPQSTQIGDFICRLDGDSTHFVFRKIGPGGKVDEENTTWAVVGIRYIEQSAKDRTETIAETFVLQ